MTDEKKPTQLQAQIPLGGGGLMQPRDFAEMIEFCKMLANSGVVPDQYKGKTGAVFVAIQLGAELQLSPVNSLRFISVIGGRPTVWGDALLGITLNDPRVIDILETLDEKTKTARCEVVMQGRAPIVRTFSWADAEKAGLASKPGNWQQYPKRMLAMRARGFACRDAIPDRLAGVLTREEAHDIIDMGPAHFAEPVAGGLDNPAPPPEAPPEIKEGKRNAKKRKPKPKPEPEPEPEAAPTDPHTVSDEVFVLLSDIAQACAPDDLDVLIARAAKTELSEVESHHVREAFAAADKRLAKGRR
jgi:hypothetical protein